MSSSERRRLRTSRLVHLLAGAHGDLERVLGRSERAGPPRAVYARRVVGVVEVDRHVPGAGPELEHQTVGVLGGVEEVAPAAVRFVARGRVLERHEEAARILLKAQHGELAPLAAELEHEPAAPPVSMTRSSPGPSSNRAWTR